MKGSERLLYIGNFSCFCSGVNENESLWQMKRIVITDVSIYYFPYTNFTIKTPKIQEDWNNYRKLNLTLPEMQERIKYIKSDKLDPDSITAPPLQVQQISDKQVYLIQIEQLIKYLESNGYNGNDNLIKGQAICLINKLSKEVQYMIAQNQDDNIKFIRAIIIGNAFQKYQTFRTINNIQQNSSIINWLQNSLNEEKAILEINNETLIQSYKILCECTKLVNGLNFRLSLKDHFQNLLQILSLIKAEQMIQLSLKNCELKSHMVSELTNVLQNHINIKMLDLSYNQIDDKGIDQLGRLFEFCLEINQINLSYNQIEGQEQYLEKFILKAGTLLEKVSIDLSYNLLKDSIIPIIENRLIKNKNNKISEINLSYNKLTSQGQLQLFKLFQQKTKTNLIYKILPLPLTTEIVEQVFNVKKPQLLYDAPIEENSDMLGSQTMKKLTLFKQSSSQPQHHPTIQLNQKLTVQFNPPIQIPNRYQITFNRKLNEKQLPQNLQTLQSIRQKEEEFILILNKSDISIEDMLLISEEIRDSQYYISYQISNTLCLLIWQKLNDAFLYRDCYSVGILTQASQNLGLDLSIFKEKFERLRIKLQKIEERINNFLNFKIDESKINDELDEIIALCYRQDIRGPSVDFLIALKDEKEHMVQKLIKSNYQWQTENKSEQMKSSKRFLQIQI